MGFGQATRGRSLFGYRFSLSKDAFVVAVEPMFDPFVEECRDELTAGIDADYNRGLLDSVGEISLGVVPTARTASANRVVVRRIRIGSLSCPRDGRGRLAPGDFGVSSVADDATLLDLWTLSILARLNSWATFSMIENSEQVH